MKDESTAFVEIKVRFFDGHLTPVERKAQVRQLVNANLNASADVEEIDVAIGAHTGTCSPDYCDQAMEGWH